MNQAGKMNAEKEENAVNQNKPNQAKNLCNFLIKDKNSMFYSISKINKNLDGKARRLVYVKDKVFIKMYNVAEKKKILIKTITIIYPRHTVFWKNEKY